MFVFVSLYVYSSYIDDELRRPVNSSHGHRDEVIEEMLIFIQIL